MFVDNKNLQVLYIVLLSVPGIDNTVFPVINRIKTIFALGNADV